jgi:predicted DNA-binding transcriptional regulator YafY
VSVATARRDLEALPAAGVPVYPQAGRGGGWRLLGGARTDLSGLSSSEAQALFLLAGPAAHATPEVKSALRKLLRALPETFREEAEAAASAVVADPAAWGAVGKEPPGLVRVLRDATCTVLGEEEDGRDRVRVAAPMALSLAEQLAGWGARAEVVGPDEVGAELARIGAELVARYAS